MTDQQNDKLLQEITSIKEQMDIIDEEIKKYAIVLSLSIIDEGENVQKIINQAKKREPLIELWGKLHHELRIKTKAMEEERIDKFYISVFQFNNLEKRLESFERFLFELENMVLTLSKDVKNLLGAGNDRE